ncbi:MAG TPA: DnaJ domain-containing protein, partial [Thermodesulfobacteriota bacterium]|nr:DnaJ domain-containing protein [Thermodesulfobacteriota bacterium]
MVVKTSKTDKYYQILGLTPEASEEEIKQAYRDLVNVWHPDRFPYNQRLKKK